MKTRQEKEQIIVGNLINCNKEINNFLTESVIARKNNRKLFESSNIYNHNLISLYSNIIGINILNINENQIISDNNVIQNTRKNYYSYFKKVHNFLDTYEPSIINSLNESINTGEIKKPIQLNILTFKDELKKLIDDLSKINDMVNYSTDVLKIKSFTKTPIFVNGYNICNNIALMKELQEKFKILYQNILAICFNNSTKQLYFVTNNTSKLVVYDVEKDVLDYYNNVNTPIEIKQLTANNYLEILKTLTTYNSIMELYINVTLLDIKFTDNLYKDNAYMNFRERLKQQMQIIK